MSRTFLAMVQDVVSDLGVAGGTIGAVTGLTSQEQIRICNWVARADLYIQNLWADWKFLWYLDNAASASANQDFVTPVLPTWAASIANIDNKSVWIFPGTAQARQIQWMDWEKFYQIYQVKPKTTQTYPTFFSLDPSGKMWLNTFVPALTQFAMQYRCFSNRMVNNGDVSPLPSQFDQVICERAKLYYAGRENAVEIQTDSMATYTDQLEKLEAFYLPNNIAGRKHQNDYTTTPQSYVE